MAGDLDPLFEPPPETGAQPMAYRQGVVVAFDQATGQNSVTVGGTTLSNLPLLGVAEAATLGPGSVVGIISTGREYAIVGRFVRPNGADYIDAVNRLSNSIVTDQIDTGEDTTSLTFVNLTTIGPTVPVTVKSSQRLLIIVSCVIIANDTDIVNGGLMGVDVYDATGATIYNAASLPTVGFYYSDNATHALGDMQGASRVFLVSLAPGQYTVQAKYRAEGSSNTTFSGRNVTCIAL